MTMNPDDDSSGSPPVFPPPPAAMWSSFNRSPLYRTHLPQPIAEAIHLYKPTNKSEVRLVYRFISNAPLPMRHQKSYSFKKYGETIAWHFAKQAFRYINETGQVPSSFFSSNESPIFDLSRDVPADPITLETPPEPQPPQQAVDKLVPTTSDDSRMAENCQSETPSCCNPKTFGTTRCYVENRVPKPPTPPSLLPNLLYRLMEGHPTGVKENQGVKTELNSFNQMEISDRSIDNSDRVDSLIEVDVESSSTPDPSTTQSDISYPVLAQLQTCVVLPPSKDQAASSSCSDDEDKDQTTHPPLMEEAKDRVRRLTLLTSDGDDQPAKKLPKSGTRKVGRPRKAGVATKDEVDSPNQAESEKSYKKRKRPNTDNGNDKAPASPEQDVLSGCSLVGKIKKQFLTAAETKKKGKEVAPKNERPTPLSSELVSSLAPDPNDSNPYRRSYRSSKRRCSNDPSTPLSTPSSVDLEWFQKYSNAFTNFCNTYHLNKSCMDNSFSSSAEKVTEMNNKSRVGWLCNKQRVEQPFTRSRRKMIACDDIKDAKFGEDETSSSPLTNSRPQCEIETSSLDVPLDDDYITTIKRRAVEEVEKTGGLMSSILFGGSWDKESIWSDQKSLHSSRNESPFKQHANEFSEAAQIGELCFSSDDDPLRTLMAYLDFHLLSKAWIEIIPIPNRIETVDVLPPRYQVGLDNNSNDMKSMLFGEALKLRLSSISLDELKNQSEEREDDEVDHLNPPKKQKTENTENLNKTLQMGSDFSQKDSSNKFEKNSSSVSHHRSMTPATFRLRPHLRSLNGEQFNDEMKMKEDFEMYPSSLIGRNRTLIAAMPLPLPSRGINTDNPCAGSVNQNYSVVSSDPSAQSFNRFPNQPQCIDPCAHVSYPVLEDPLYNNFTKNILRHRYVYQPLPWPPFKQFGHNHQSQRDDQFSRSSEVPLVDILDDDSDNDKQIEEQPQKKRLKTSTGRHQLRVSGSSSRLYPACKDSRITRSVASDHCSRSDLFQPHPTSNYLSTQQYVNSLPSSCASSFPSCPKRRNNKRPQKDPRVSTMQETASQNNDHKNIHLLDLPTAFVPTDEDEKSIHAKRKKDERKMDTTTSENKENVRSVAPVGFVCTPDPQKFSHNFPHNTNPDPSVSALVPVDRSSSGIRFFATPAASILRPIRLLSPSVDDQSYF